MEIERRGERRRGEASCLDLMEVEQDEIESGRSAEEKMNCKEVGSLVRNRVCCLLEGRGNCNGGREEDGRKMERSRGLLAIFFAGV